MKRALIILCLLAGGAIAHADDDCDYPFVACFDPGNRFFLSAGTATTLGPGTIGGGIYLRRFVFTEDSEVTWRLEHDLADVAVGSAGWRFALYRGRFLRHSDDGHIMLPTNPPKKLFLHSDLGVELDVGVADEMNATSIFHLGAIRAAVLADVLRSPDFSKRLSLALVSRWDLVVDVHAPTSPIITEELVSPFTMGAINLHLESQNGLSVLDLSVEGGAIWSDQVGFHRTLAVAGSVERILVAVNDRPVSLFLTAGWDETRGALAEAGLRIALVSKGKR